jgi:hypothetical protein
MQLRLLAIAGILLSCLAPCGRALAQDTVIVRHDPLFFLDSVRLNKDSLSQMNSNEIAMITVIKDGNAIRLLGPEGANGVVYITSKHFARNKYWHFLSARSLAYATAFSDPDADSTVTYVINKKVLGDSYEADLMGLDAATYRSLRIVNHDALKKEFGVEGKQYAVIIQTDTTGKQ